MIFKSCMLLGLSLSLAAPASAQGSFSDQQKNPVFAG
jgi:hypothetical protein